MNFSTTKSIVVSLCLIVFSLGVPAGSQAQQEESLILASQIIDGDVYTGNQELIGEVDDLIIKRSGRVKKLTIEFGGFFDIGDKLVALSFKSFSMKDGNVTLEPTLQELEKRPEFDYFAEGLRSEYYYRPSPYPGAYRYPTFGYYYGPGQPDPLDAFEWAFSPSRFLASVAMNRRLINERGQGIGRLRDLVINRKNNKVEKIVLFSGDILGRNVHVALPYEPLGFTAYGLVYDIMPGELNNFVYPYEEE
jgi:hypothetical protein